MPVSLQPCVDGFKSFGRNSNQELKISVWHFSATTQVSANMLIANLHVARICVIKWAVLPQTTHSEMAGAPRSACEQWWKRAHENGSVSRTLCRVIDDDVLSVLSHSGGDMHTSQLHPAGCIKSVADQHNCPLSESQLSHVYLTWYPSHGYDSIIFSFLTHWRLIEDCPSTVHNLSIHINVPASIGWTGFVLQHLHIFCRTL